MSLGGLALGGGDAGGDNLHRGAGERVPPPESEGLSAMAAAAAGARGASRGPSPPPPSPPSRCSAPSSTWRGWRESCQGSLPGGGLLAAGLPGVAAHPSFRPGGAVPGCGGAWSLTGAATHPPLLATRVGVYPSLAEAVDPLPHSSSSASSWSVLRQLLPHWGGGASVLRGSSTPLPGWHFDRAFARFAE